MAPSEWSRRVAFAAIPGLIVGWFVLFDTQEIFGAGAHWSRQWAIPIGYAYALVMGQLVALVTGGLWKKWRPGINNPPPQDLWVAVIIGVVERTLYVSALLGGHTTFIGFWLGVKVAGWWKGTAEDVSQAKSSFFASFLVGSGLSVAYAGVGSFSIRLLQAGQWEKAVVVMASLVFLTMVLWSMTAVVLPATDSGDGRDSGSATTPQ